MNNPPAFPQAIAVEKGANQSGMTLRDYFAAKAMQAQITARTGRFPLSSEIPQTAYKMADAMLKEREK
jgi:hypothetical protein